MRRSKSRTLWRRSRVIRPRQTIAHCVFRGSPGSGNAAYFILPFPVLEIKVSRTMMDYKFCMIAILKPLLSACVAQFDNYSTNSSLRFLIAISHWRFTKHECVYLKDHLKLWRASIKSVVDSLPFRSIGNSSMWLPQRFDDAVWRNSWLLRSPSASFVN